MKTRKGSVAVLTLLFAAAAVCEAQWVAVARDVSGRIQQMQQTNSSGTGSYGNLKAAGFVHFPNIPCSRNAVNQPAQISQLAVYVQVRNNAGHPVIRPYHALASH